KQVDRAGLPQRAGQRGGQLGLALTARGGTAAAVRAGRRGQYRDLAWPQLSDQAGPGFRAAAERRGERWHVTEHSGPGPLRGHDLLRRRRAAVLHVRPAAGLPAHAGRPGPVAPTTRNLLGRPATRAVATV